MTTFRKRHAMAALVAGGFIAATVGTVHAAELGFFEALFGGARPAPQAVEPITPYPSAYRQRSRRAFRPRTRYVALSRVEPLKVHIGDRQTPIDMKAGPVAALMRDDTLRRGDIVVLSTGARVFVGNPDKTHAMRDFEPVERSASLDSGTRRQLATMMAPAAALPSDQARRVVERIRKTAPALAGPVTTQAMRVINPWTAAR